MSSSVPNTPLIVSPQPHDDATSDHNRSPSLPPPPSSISSLLNVTSKSTDDSNQDPVTTSSPSSPTTTSSNHCGATDQQQRKRPFSALENNDDLTITTNTNDSTSSKEHEMDSQGDTSNQQQSSSSSSSSSWPGNYHQQQQQSHHLPTPVSPAAPMPHQNKIPKVEMDERQPSMNTSESGSPAIKEEYHMVQRTKADTPGGMYTSFSLKQTNPSNHGTGASAASSSSSSSNKGRGSRDNGSTVSKPYTCSECNQTFNRLHNLKSHAATHSMERPYKVNVWDENMT